MRTNSDHLPILSGGVLCFHEYTNCPEKPIDSERLAFGRGVRHIAADRGHSKAGTTNHSEAGQLDAGDGFGISGLADGAGNQSVSATSVLDVGKLCRTIHARTTQASESMDSSTKIAEESNRTGQGTVRGLDEIELSCLERTPAGNKTGKAQGDSFGGVRQSGCVSGLRAAVCGALQRSRQLSLNGREDKGLAQRLTLLASLITISLLNPTTSLAQNKQKPRPDISVTRCIDPAADFHKVNPWILASILKVESSFNPKARNLNSNGTVDVGMGQMNTIHFKELGKHGIGPDDLQDACIATYVAAWHLAKQYKAYGNTWFAVGAYHSATPYYNQRYQALIYNAMVDFGQKPGPKLFVPPLRKVAGSQIAGTRSANQQETNRYTSGIFTNTEQQ